MPLGSVDYTGFVNANHVGIEKRVSLRPLRYRARCQNCLTTFPVDHERVPYVRCPSNCSNRPVNKPSPSLGVTGAREEAVRSSNSANSAAFRREEAENGNGEVNVKPPFPF
jgi:hypothetical protein